MSEIEANGADSGKLVDSDGPESTHPSQHSETDIAPWSQALVPEGHRVPVDATFYEGADDGRCRVVRADGTRCGAARMRAIGLCSGHAGLSAVAREPALTSKLGNEERRRRGQTRVLLGITPRTAADPRQLARIRAQARAEEIARALIDDPLDEEMSAAKRQPLVLAGLDAAFPRMTAQVEVDLPEDEAGFAALGWEELRRLEAAHAVTPPLHHDP